VLHEDHVEGPLADRAHGPVDRQQLDRLRLADRADVVGRRQPDVEVALVHDDDRALGDHLVGDVGNRDLDRPVLAVDAIAQVGRQVEREAALGVGAPAALGDQLVVVAEAEAPVGRQV
jgi:hypothetical protein